MAITTAQRQFLTYLFIGGTVFIIDIGSFQLLLRAHTVPLVAATISYALAIATHFSLNRYLNFRNFERTIAQQFGTYVVVALISWLLTLGVIAAGIGIAHLAPIVAKLCAVAINLPVGFVGHRHFTFGPGLLAGIRKYKNGRNTTPL